MFGNPKLYGTVTVGERGQVVIPVEAREALQVSAGDKMLVFDTPMKGAVALVRLEVFEEHLKQISQGMFDLQEQVSVNKQSSKKSPQEDHD